MKKWTKNAIVLSVISTMILVCVWAVVNEHRQFDYVYLDGTYYYVTNRYADDELKKEEVQSVTQIASIDFRNKMQEEGASNILPIGTVLYKYPSNTEVIFYRRPDSSDLRIAYKVYGDIAGDWHVYIEDLVEDTVR